MKTPQIIIMMFLGMLGIAMIIHFWGEFTVSAIISNIVGVVLILIAFISFIQFLRQKKDEKSEIQ